MLCFIFFKIALDNQKIMINNESKIRVRYAETDQMGFVYYGKYAEYFEIGRVAALKEVGISYRSMEEKGYLLPVKELKVNYKRAAQYDDELTIVTEVRDLPSNRITFYYTIKRGEELLVDGETTLFFMDRSSKPCRPPQFFIDQMKPFFNR